MEYIEKDLPAFKEIDISSMQKMEKIPTFILKFILKLSIKKVRAMMGGDSKDITTRSIKSEDKIISGYKEDILIRIYRPEEDPDKIRPILVFFHGGGWIGGSIGAVEEFCRGVCDQADCVVVNVDYHLAPEHPFPEGLEDSYKAIKWAIKNRNLLKIDENKLILGGDSAGGNFTAAITFLAQDRKEFKISKQLLIYPATKLTFDSAENLEKISKTDKLTSVMSSLYFKKKVDPSNPYISPALAKSFINQPDALIAVGDKDFLYKSSLGYAKKLDDAGNKVKFILYKNANHAFIDDTGKSEQANDLVSESALFLKEE